MLQKFFSSLNEITLTILAFVGGILFMLYFKSKGDDVNAKKIVSNISDMSPSEKLNFLRKLVRK